MAVVLNIYTFTRKGGSKQSLKERT